MKEIPAVTATDGRSGFVERVQGYALLPTIAVMAAITLLHVLTNGRYGFHRDEWQFLSDARHLDWGFVAYPPFTAFMQRIGLDLFGLNMNLLRIFSVAAQVLVLLFTGKMAREFGGGRWAQFAAVLTVAIAPYELFEGTEFQYGTYDLLWWVLVCYFTVRLIKSENPRYWLAIGAAAGLGLMTKYTIALLLVGLMVGCVIGPNRKLYWNRWAAAGVALAFLIFLPELIWLARHDWVTIHFLHHIHERDVRNGRADGFFPRQFWINTIPVVAPVWIAGLIYSLRTARWRVLAPMYLAPFVLLWTMKGRDYYCAPVYPMMVALGSGICVEWFRGLRPLWRRVTATAFWVGVVASGLLFCAVMIPLFNNGPIKKFALSLNGDLREEFGWHELAASVASVYNSLPAEERTKTGIIVGNYGEAGSLEFLGPEYQLPTPISLTNSAWLWSDPQIPPEQLIVVGMDRDEAEEKFTACKLAGHYDNNEGIRNEESEHHPDIFLCGSPKDPWPVFWKKNQRFG